MKKQPKIYFFICALFLAISLIFTGCQSEEDKLKEEIKSLEKASKESKWASEKARDKYEDLVSGLDKYDQLHNRLNSAKK